MHSDSVMASFEVFLAHLHFVCDLSPEVKSGNAAALLGAQKASAFDVCIGNAWPIFASITWLKFDLSKIPFLSEKIL